MFDSFNFTQIDTGWQQALSNVQPNLAALEKKITQLEAEGQAILPARSQILRAFTYPFAKVRVLIVGQDPYPTPGNAVGLSFSVAADQPTPASLRNIFKEISADLGEGEGVKETRSPDLSDWAKQGVCLLNRVLTVTAGKAGSHRKLGWQVVTETAVRALVSRGRPLVVFLWGKDAQQLRPLIPDDPQILVVESAHPSPLSARRGFFGSKPFSQANQHLQAHGLEPIKWC